MISIIVPIFNVEKYLPYCLNSLLSQTEHDLQIILVDDGSTDNSLNIAQHYADKDTRIKLLQQTHAGQSAARNHGIEHAAGEYIAFVDADDTIAPNWCECHLAAIKTADYVQSGYIRINENGEPSGKHRIPFSVYQYTSPCMRLYKRSIIRQHPFTEGVIYEDVLFSIRLWAAHHSCYILNYTGYNYRLNPSSTTSRRNPMAEKTLYNHLWHTQAPVWLKIYTFLRLKCHFILS